MMTRRKVAEPKEPRTISVIPSTWEKYKEICSKNGWDVSKRINIYIEKDLKSKS